MPQIANLRVGFVQNVVASTTTAKYVSPTPTRTIGTGGQAQVPSAVTVTVTPIAGFPLNDSDAKSAPMYATPEGQTDFSPAANRHWANSAQYPFFNPQPTPGAVASSTDDPAISFDTVLERTVTDANGNGGAVDWTLDSIVVQMSFRDFLVIAQTDNNGGYQVIAPLAETSWSLNVNSSNLQANASASPGPDAQGGSPPTDSPALNTTLYNVAVNMAANQHTADSAQNSTVTFK